MFSFTSYNQSCTKFIYCILIILVSLALPAQAQTVQTEIQKFLPDGITDNDFWGRAVSIDGNRAIVGGFSDVYIFEYDATADTWIEAAELNAPPGGGGAFGYSVSIQGDRALVGAYLNNGGVGTAYIFEYNAATDQWEEVVQLLASDGTADDWFGQSVSLDGDRVVVGALLEDPGDVQSAGSVYVFERQTDGSWPEVAKLVASDGVDFDQFGFSVAASGDRILVGATFAGSPVAYLFDYDALADQWVETQLIPSDAGPGDRFGISVSLDGDRALVGASGLNVNGAAYLFEYDTTADQWDETKLTASDGALNDAFGYAVYIEGDLALIGSPFEAPDDINLAGSAYLFKYNAGEDTWEEKVKLLVSDRERTDVFGTAVAISGGFAIVGSSETEFSGIGDSGAYLFQVPVASCGGFDVFRGRARRRRLRGTGLRRRGDRQQRSIPPHLRHPGAGSDCGLGRPRYHLRPQRRRCHLRRPRQGRHQRRPR